MDEGLQPLDIRDTTILTQLIDESLLESAVYNVPFAPIVPYSERQVKLVVRALHGAGLASFKADDGSTPVTKGSLSVREVFMELVTIAEKDPIKATDLLKLASSDRSIGYQSMRTIVERGKVLRLRNIQRTKWMAWQAAKDALTITYPDGGTVAIDFGLNDTDDTLHKTFTASHLPTAATAWNHTAAGEYDADIISDVQTWANYIALDAGVSEAECNLYVNSATAKILRKNAGIKAELGPVQRLLTPTLTEIAQVLGIANVFLYNDFYEDISNALTRFLTDGYGLFTGPNQVNGVNIMDVKDGPCVLFQNGQLTVASNPGMAAEIYVNPDQSSENMRVQTARMPVMNIPAAFLYARLW